MIIRTTDSIGDWAFGKGKQSYLSEGGAIGKNIETRLKEFLNDAFWNQAAGADWPRLLGAPGNEKELELTCRSIILQSYGVTAVNSIDVIYDPRERNITMTCNLNTLYTSNFSLQIQQNFSQMVGG